MHPHISHTNYSFHTRTTPLVLQEGPNGVYGLCNAVMLSGVWRGGGGEWRGQGGGGGKRASEQTRKKGQERARKSVKRHERVRKKERKLKQRLCYDVFLRVHVCVCVYVFAIHRECVYASEWVAYVISHVPSRYYPSVYHTWRIYICTHAVCLMGWLRLVGSLKLYVSFLEYHLFYGALLQKRPTILRSY